MAAKTCEENGQEKGFSKGKTLAIG